MLDHLLLPLMHTATSPKIITRLENYLSTLRVRQLQMISRAIGMPGTNSGGARVMVQILGDADVKWLNNGWSNDMDRLQFGLLDKLTGLERLFTPYISGQSLTALFVDRTHRCAEFFVPVRMRNPVTGYPQTGRWQEWQMYRPFHVVDIDSDELTFETHADRIRFVRNPPTRLVYTLDVAGLILQYACYRRTYNPNQPEMLSIGDYLHRYVITEALVDDLTSLWLLQRYLTVMRNPDDAVALSGVIEDSSRHGVYGSIGQTLPAALESVRDVVLDTRSGSVLPATLLASLKLGTFNLPTVYQQLCTHSDVSDLRHERWVSFLRNYRWIEIVLALYLLNPTTSTMRNLGVALRRDIPLLISTRFWESIRHQPTRLWVEQRIRRMLTMFTTY